MCIIDIWNRVHAYFRPKSRFTSVVSVDEWNMKVNKSTKAHTKKKRRENKSSKKFIRSTNLDLVRIVFIRCSDCIVCQKPEWMDEAEHIESIMLSTDEDGMHRHFPHNGLYLIRFDKRTFALIRHKHSRHMFADERDNAREIHDAEWCKRRTVHSMALHKLKWPTHLKEQRTDQEVMISVSHVTRLTQSTVCLVQRERADSTRNFSHHRQNSGSIRSVTVSVLVRRRCCCPDGCAPTAIILFLNEFSCRFAVWDTTCIVANGRCTIWASWAQRGSPSDDSHRQETKLRVDDSLILCSALLLLHFFRTISSLRCEVHI